MPNPDGSMTDDEMRAMFTNLAGHPPPAAQTTPTQTSSGGYYSTARVNPDGGYYATYNPRQGASSYGVVDGLGNPVGMQDRDTWANAQSGNKPWLSRGESSQETRNNFYYGGAANGASQFNAGLGRSMSGLGVGFDAIRGGAAQLGSNAQSAQSLAQARDPYAFVDQNSVASNNLDRGAQQQAIGMLGQFATQGQGPSAAQAQLNQATDMNLANSLAFARSGRGMGGSAAGMRQAIGQNALTQQQSVNQAAALRAQEYQQFQQNKLNALGSMGGLAGQARQGDVQLGSYLSGTAQARQNGADQAALGYGQQAIGAGQLGLAAQQANAANALGFAGLQSDVNKSQLNANANYEQNVQNGYLQKMAQDASAVKGTDYTPYLAAGGAIVGAAIGGPGGAIAGGAAGSAVGNAANNA